MSNFIYCEICNQKFHRISSNHLKKHNITLNVYKELFPLAPIISEDLKIKQKSINVGKTTSEETKTKLSKIGKGRPSKKKGKPLSADTKLKMSMAHQKSNTSIKQKTDLRISNHLSQFNISVLCRSNTGYNLFCNTCKTEFHGVKTIFAEGKYKKYNGKYCRTCYPQKQRQHLDTQDDYFKYNFQDSSLPGKFYIINIFNDDECFLKIGITSKTVAERFKKLKNYSFKTILEKDVEIGEAHFIEQTLLKHFSNFKYIPTIKFNGYTECLSYSILNEMINIL